MLRRNTLTAMTSPVSELKILVLSINDLLESHVYIPKGP